MKKFWMFFLILFSASCDAEQYSARECIVRVQVLWEDQDDNLKNRFLNDFMDIYVSAPDNGFNKIPPSVAFQGDQSEFIFFQHKFDCENRIRNTQFLVDFVVQRTDDAPEMIVDEVMFEPGLDTIISRGEWWSNN